MKYMTDEQLLKRAILLEVAPRYLIERGYVLCKEYKNPKFQVYTHSKETGFELVLTHHLNEPSDVDTYFRLLIDHLEYIDGGRDHVWILTRELLKPCPLCGKPKPSMRMSAETQMFPHAVIYCRDTRHPRVSLERETMAQVVIDWNKWASSIEVKHVTA